MGGTLEGGKKAAETNKKKYGPNFYARIGREGGVKGTTGGWYAMKLTDPERVSELGRKGGQISKRTKKG